MKVLDQEFQEVFGLTTEWYNNICHNASHTEMDIMMESFNGLADFKTRREAIRIKYKYKL